MFKRVKVIFFSLYFFVLLLIAVVSLFCYTHLKKQIMETYYYSSMNQLDTIVSTDETTRQALKNLCIQVTFDNSIRKLFYSTPSAINLVQAEQSLQKLGSFVNSVATIYIYNGDKQTLYFAFGQEKTTSYNGIEIETLKGSKSYQFQEFVLTADEGSDTDVLLYSYTTEDINNVVLITANDSNLKKHYTDYCARTQSYLYVLNNDSKLIYSSGDFAFGDTLPAEYSDCIQPDSKYSFQWLEGSKYMCISQQSPQTGYTYLTLIPYDTVSKSILIQRKYYFFIIIMMFFVFTSSFFFFFWSKLHKPLYNIFSKATSYDKYEHRKKRESDLTKYLTTEFPNEYVAMNAYQHLAPYMEDNGDLPIHLVSFSINEFRNFQSANPASGWEVLKEELSLLCTELISDCYPALPVNDTDPSVTLIVIGCAEENMDRLHSIIEKCLAAAKEQLSLSLTAAVSSNSDFENLYSAYIQLQEIQNYRYNCGYDKILNETILKTDIDDSESTRHLIKKLCALLLENNFDHALEVTESLIQSLKQFTPEKAHLLVMEFLISFTEHVNKLKKVFALPDSMEQVSFFQTVITAETLDQVNSLIQNKIEELSKEFLQKETDKQPQISRQVLELIDTNFRDVGFCADSVASALNLSTAYVNRIYKQETGATLADTILEKRLEYSAKILQQTNLSIKEVSLQSGFINNSYFIVLFKKHFNCTPAMYRKYNSLS